MARPGRVLGVDPGTVRIGLAVSDPDRLVATPHGIVEGGKGDADRVAAVAAELGCEVVVVGLPRSMSGRDTDSTRMARTLAEALGSRGLTVHLHDERLTSVQADRAGRASRGGRRASAARTATARRKGTTDQMAASVLLQAWLDSPAARP